MSLKDAEAGSKTEYDVTVRDAYDGPTGLEGTLRDQHDATGTVRALKARHIQLIGESTTRPNLVVVCDAFHDS